MFALVLPALLTAVEPDVIALEFEAQQVSASVARLVSTQITQRLSARGVAVMTSEDVAAMLGMERQKQLLGCASDTSCLAELGAAMNAGAAMRGSIGQLGNTRLLDVRVVSTRDARVLALCSARVTSDDALLTEADRCADQLVLTLKPQAAPVTPTHTWGLVPLVGGGAIALGGGAVLALSQVQRAELQTATEAPPVVFARAKTAETLATAGLITAGVGAALAVTGLVVLVTGPAPVTPTATITPAGASVGLVGVFP